ncbi:hypothetical protein ABEB36_000861 [Hypothenemus hampei]|uniref:RING-type domain-containing protein n=1 Tax=Hypothenemus hampei TaxID=57062 RepID=A0ABD1FCR2_HYPHA
MLHALVSTVNFLLFVFTRMLYCSYKIGFCLIQGIITVLPYLYAVVSVLVNFLVVFIEALIIFLTDVAVFIEQLVKVVLSILEAFNKIIYGINNPINTIISGLKLIPMSIIAGITNVLNLITGLLSFIRTFFILLGSGVWFLVLSIPLVAYNVILTTATIIKTCYEDILNLLYMALMTAVHFVLDVPIESFFGLITFVLLYLIVKQTRLLITSRVNLLKRKLRNWYRLFVQPRPQPRRERQPVASRQPIHRDKKEGVFQEQDKYCVICQERLKCVLLLPCKHICLCQECQEELRYYHEMCPICRTNIESTMRVYF